MMNKVLRRVLNVSQPKQILVCLVLGLACGLCFGEKVASLKILGDIFLKMIKMTIGPLVFTLVMNVFASLDNKNKKAGSIVIKSIFFYKILTIISVLFGLVILIVLHPGIGVNIPCSSVDLGNAKDVSVTTFSFTNIILDTFPSNILDSFLRNDIIQIFIIAIFFGIAVNRIGKCGNNVKKFVESMSVVILRVIEMIIKFTPIAIFGIMAYVAGTQDLNTLKSLVFLFVILFSSGVFITYVFYGLLLVLFKLNPLRFFRKVFKVQSFAFLTCSSGATIPMATSVAENELGVSKNVATIVVPLGGAFNLSATAMQIAMITVFFAQVHGIDLLFSHYVQIFTLSIILTMGAIAVPAAILVMLPITLVSIGVPVEYVALYVGIDRFLDMLRSSMNAASDVLAAVLIDRSQGSLDLDEYNK